jgi:hypothetical protein
VCVRVGVDSVCGCMSVEPTVSVEPTHLPQVRKVGRVFVDKPAVIPSVW